MNPILKRLLNLTFFLGWAGIVAFSNSSCSSSVTPPSADAIVLAQLNSQSWQPFVPPSYSIGSSDTCLLRLSCGCTFVLNPPVASGDTSAFMLVDLDTMSMKKSPHRIAITCLTSTKGQSATYIFSAVDHFNNTKYDTLRLSTSF